MYSSNNAGYLFTSIDYTRTPRQASRAEDGLGSFESRRGILFQMRYAPHYQRQGEPCAAGSGGNGGVYLRNLTNDTTLTLVEPDNSGQYAIPRLYEDDAICFRNRVLHRVTLNGSNDVPVLPMGGKQHLHHPPLATVDTFSLLQLTSRT